MAKLTFKSESQKGLLKGINQLTDAVGSTMGAHGQTALFLKGNEVNGVPQSTKDGVTVAQHIELDDPLENLGASIVKEAARKTAKIAGDGTTSTTVLARAILTEAVGREGSQRDYIRGIEAATKKVIKYLDKESVEITDEMIDYVANISTNSDSELGPIVSKAFKDVGEYGYVWYQPNLAGVETHCTVETGAQIQRGLLDPAFVNNKKMETCDLTNPLIFMSTSKLDSPRQIESILERAVKEKRALLVIAEAEPQVGQVLAANKINNDFHFNIINPPHHGIFMRESMEDIADMVGAKLHGAHLGDGADSITGDMCGTADFVQSNVMTTVINIKKKVDLSERIENIKTTIKNEGNPDRVKSLERRLATIAGGIGMIYVGAPSESEVVEKMARVDDAIHAVSASLREGILPGGGIALKNASESITIPSGVDDYTKGFKALLSAINTPYEVILKNADLKAPDNLKKDWGVNVLTGKKVDMKKEGIIDPTLAVKEAVINSVSVSKTILQTGVTIL